LLKAPTRGLPETKELLAGYWMIDVEKQQRAIEIAANPMVTLNRAIATAMVHGPEAGPHLLRTVEDSLKGNHRLQAVGAHLHEMAGDFDAAAALYRDAARRTTSLPERHYLTMVAGRLARHVRRGPGMMAGMDTTQLITSIMPRLVVDDAAAAIEFYTKAVGAVERDRFEDGGKIAHALLLIDGQPVALKDEDDVDPSPRTLGGSPVLLSVEVTDVDAVAARMIMAGARVVFAVDNHGYGYKDGRFEDPFGHLWLISQPIAG